MVILSSLRDRKTYYILFFLRSLVDLSGKITNPRVDPWCAHQGTTFRPLMASLGFG